jgi:cellulose synthase/poly-beta-1,6-N-acetylglucosamine synthase-like glycosyltransferase
MQRLEKIRIRLIVVYLLYILYEFLWTPLMILGHSPWVYNPYRIHYNIVIPKLIVVAVILTLIYFGIRYRQVSQLKKEQ